MKKPLLIFNPDSDPDRLNEIKKAVSWLATSQEFNIVESYLDKLKTPILGNASTVDVFITEAEAIQASDGIISLGGDGTVLYCVRALADMTGSDWFDLPVLPINFGTVGFICPFTIEDLYSDSIYNYEISERMLLTCNDYGAALNEISLIKNDYGIRNFRIKYNNQDVSEFRADGVILSTATGSTAYSFSCNGPIIFPGQGNDIVSITPIAAMDASLRPIILPLGDGDGITVSSENCRCLIDGLPRPDVHQITIKKYSQKLKLATPINFNYFNLLKEKLGWSRLTS